MDGPQFISAAVVKSVLDYRSLFQAVENGLANYTKRKEVNVVQPVRTAIHIQQNDGYLGCMPVYSQPDNILATKLVTYYPCNKDIPTHHAVIVVFSTETGVPRAIVDGDIITTMRTAAVSVVATKYLAKDNPRTLAILGSGNQARSHYAALSEMFAFKQIRVWNHRYEGAKQLADEIGETCSACSSVEDAVSEADVIVTVTGSKVPFLKAAWVKPGAHINAVGACRPDWAEIDPDLMRSAIVYVDSFEGALKESGDIIMAQADVYAEIGEVISGEKEGKRNQVTVFKSLGLAIEDGVAVKLALNKLGVLL